MPISKLIKHVYIFKSLNKQGSFNKTQTINSREIDTNTNENKITININNVYFFKSKNMFLKFGGVIVQKLI